MSFSTTGSIRYFQFESFGPEIKQAVFTRHGGVSPSPWDSLNLGGTVGDATERVRENRRLALAALGSSPDSVYDVWQVHGISVVVADAPRPPETPHLKADGILTNKPGITLLMRFADCVPLLFHDPAHGVVGIAHAGWLGTLRGAATAMVAAMRDHFGTLPRDIHAAIGPCIGPDHYQVGEDVARQVRQVFGSDSSGLLPVREEAIYFDLWSANRLLLEHSGVGSIEVAEICTACHTDDWFSHRAEKGSTGRFGALIALQA
jgi:polyphenol oxidase